MNYLIYHPPRKNPTNIGDFKVYHDAFGNNEDPYIWNDSFLHSFCHITQIRPEIGSLIFWVSGDSYPDFNSLYCDCVFLVDQKVVWKNANYIESTDSIVDNLQCFKHHYSWVNPPHLQHVFKKRKRYTLKAHKDKSFQPQDSDGNLIDIVPFLMQNNISLTELCNTIGKTKSGKRAINSKPYLLSDSVAKGLYDLLSKSSIKITGQMIKDLHPFR